MASFQSTTGRDRQRMREKKYSRSDPFQPDPEQGIPRKQKKKFKKLKNTVMASFPAKTGTGQAKNERKKIYHSDPFNPNPEQEFPKNQRKKSKIKEHNYGLF